MMQFEHTLPRRMESESSLCSGCSGCSCEHEDVSSRSVTMSVASYDRQSSSNSDKDVQSLIETKVRDLGYTPVPSPSPPGFVSTRQCSSGCLDCMDDVRYEDAHRTEYYHGYASCRNGCCSPPLAPTPYAMYHDFQYRGGYYNTGRYYKEYTHPVSSNPPVKTLCRRYVSLPPPPPTTLPTPLPAPAFFGNARGPRVLPVRKDSPITPRSEEDPVPQDIDDTELPSFDCLLEQNLCKLAFRREGSMLLQKMLPKMTMIEKESLLNQLMDVLVSLSCNAYGNYVVQQLIDEVTFEQRRQIAHVLGREVVALSMNIHGYCVVNKLIESVCVETQIRLLDCVSSHIKEMCLHEYASQVMICFIVKMPPLFLHPVTTTFCGRSWFFATHSTSHRVLTTLIDRVTPIKRNELISEIANFVVQLSKDPVGNYVVQHVLGAPAECGAVSYIRMQLVENFYLLSLNKIASHVVEKLLQTSSRSELESAVEWVVTSSNKKLIKLINSPFGNYVMKTLTELASRSQRRRIAGRVEPITTRVRCSPFLKHLRELQVMQ